MISMVHDMWDKEAGTSINSYRPNLRARIAWLIKDSESSRLPELTLRASTSGELHHPRCVPPPESDMAKMASERFKDKLVCLSLHRTWCLQWF